MERDAGGVSRLVKTGIAFMLACNVLFFASLIALIFGSPDRGARLMLLALISFFGGFIILSIGFAPNSERLIAKAQPKRHPSQPQSGIRAPLATVYTALSSH